MNLPVNQVVCGHVLDVLSEFPDGSVDMMMFSPPYWGLRDYGKGTEADWGDWKGQLGLEPHPKMFLSHMTTICLELKRVLKKQGSMYVDMGDTYYSSTSHSEWSGTHRNGKPDDKWYAGDKGDSHRFNVKRAEVDGGWLQPKQKLLMPHRLAIRLQDTGWILRNDIVWHKPNAMPSSVKDRLNCCHEYVFHFVQARKYWYDLDAIREPHAESTFKRVSQDLSLQHGGPKESEYRQKHIIPAGGSRKEISQILKNLKPNVLSGKGKNPGDVWSVYTKPFPEAHFAVYPVALCVKPIKSSCPDGGIVLDPFCGAGSTLIAAQKLGRKWIGIDISEEYCEMAKLRIERECAEKLTGWFENT